MIQNEWNKFVDRSLGVPFIDHGRTYEGWDCWGLVMCGYREVLDIDLPDMRHMYGNIRQIRQLKKLVLTTCSNNDTHVKCGPELGSIAVMYWRDWPICTGIVVSKNDILRCQVGAGTFTEFIRECNIHSFWRVR